MDDWGVGLARSGEAISQVHAPGHGVKRCCYVDFLNTGPAVAGTLRKRVGKTANIRKVSDLQVVDLIIDDGQVVGAAALHTVDGSTITSPRRRQSSRPVGSQSPMHALVPPRIWEVRALRLPCALVQN